jgi:hypothetical protein
VTTKPAMVNLRVTALHGYAVYARTVTLVAIGTGFYASPRVTSTAVGVHVIVVRDTGRALVLRVTTRSPRARGWHTLTIRLANGRQARVNYLTK